MLRIAQAFGPRMQLQDLPRHMLRVRRGQFFMFRVRWSSLLRAIVRLLWSVRRSRHVVLLRPRFECLHPAERI